MEEFDKSSLYYVDSTPEGTRYSLYDTASWKNGLAFKNIDFSETGLPVIKIAELNNGISSSTAYTDKTYSQDVFLTKGDYVFSWSGNPETSIDIYKYNLSDGWLNQHIFKVTPKTEIIDKGFFFYLMKFLKPYFKKIATNKQTTGLGHVTISDLQRMSVTLPPLPTQQKIAAILSSLDDKIELNNKINTNLEQQVQALFKNWFVDFEPFGGKMPEGWKEIPLEELCTVITKGTTPTTLGKKFTDSGINFIKGESILDNHTFDLQKISHIDDETNLMLKRSIIQPNDILFTIAGTLGRFAIIDETLTPANTNQAVGIIRANPEIISPYYLYSFFIGNWHNDYYTKRIQQAVQANLSLGTIKSLPIIIPDSQNLNKYTALIEPLFKQMKQLENENIKLANLRDTILPKLINGEIEV